MENLFDNLPIRQSRKGQVLIYEGDNVKNIFFLVGGYVKVFSILPSGNQRILVIYGPGDIFPLTSFLSGSGIAVYFHECMTDIELKSIPQADFQQKIRGNLEIGEKLIAYTYRLNQLFMDRINILSAHSARQKIASLLVYLAKRVGTSEHENIRLDLPLTSRDVADMCGLTRETATLQLIRMKKEGIVSGGRYLIVDRQQLKKLIAS
ncbi:MAG TPA: Crp/Fnr family transcriptional regulator [Candidatus Saccharimonadales bacterium]|nr:Crp/Fnr family transcriptional regulator [Candidatus Saccharimonadales bacterium]